MQQYVGEKDFDQVTLHIYHTIGEETSYIYEDDNNTFEYEKGNSRYLKLILTGDTEGITITRSLEGNYNSKIKSYKLELHGFPNNVSGITVDNNAVDTNGALVIDAEFNTLTIK